MFKYIIKTSGLIHYWPFFMNVHDIINEADLYEGSNVTLTQNRFYKSDSALSLTQGYYKMPPRVYFNGNFSLLTWVKIKEISY
jgi:hypothetical protein